MNLLRTALVIAVWLCTSNAAADWRAEIGTLRVGIVSAGDANAAARAEPFRLALTEKLNVPVEIFAARNATALIDATAAARVDYAVLSALAYATAWTLCECLEPLVTARAGDGSSSFALVLIGRSNGPRTPGELTGGKISAIAVPAIGGLEFAGHELRAAGLDLKANNSVLDLAPDGQAALDAFRQGRSNALLGWSSLAGDPSQGYSRGTLRLLAELDGSALGYRILWQSSPIPHRVQAVRRNLPGEARTMLRDALSAMFSDDPIAYDSIEPDFGGGFIPARQAQFDALAGFVADRRAASRAPR